MSEKHDDPPFVLDDAFVAAARYREDPAVERQARAQRIARQHTPPVGRAARRRRLSLTRHLKLRDLRGVVAVVVALGLVAAAARWGLLPDNASPTSALGAPPQVMRANDAPPNEHPGSTRIAAPVPVPQGDQSFTFLRTLRPGHPVTWSPCDRIDYVLRRQGADETIREQVAAAFAELGLRTGLTFHDAGWTDENPRDHRPPYQPRTYGKRWAPVLVAWSTPQESPRLADNTAGYAGPVSWGLRPGDEHYVSGSVTIDGPQLTALADQRRGTQGAQNVLLHELGHLVGLDHVDDPAQLMNATSSRDLDGYSAGDLRGLALLGRGSCRG